jgi:hypothetical protein
VPVEQDRESALQMGGPRDAIPDSGH